MEDQHQSSDLAESTELEDNGLNDDDYVSENENERTGSVITNPTPSTSRADLHDQKTSSSVLEKSGGNRLPKKKLPFMKRTKILSTPNFDLFIERTDFQNYSPLT